MKVGVLALQGDFREHLTAVANVGAVGVDVRSAAELAEVDALVIPGGESTTIGRLATAYDLVEPIRSRIEQGMDALRNKYVQEMGPSFEQRFPSPRFWEAYDQGMFK